MIVHPSKDDVVVLRKACDVGAIFMLGTPPVPEQFTVPNREDAVAQALAYAERQGVGAWLGNGGDELVLLGTFRKERELTNR